MRFLNRINPFNITGKSIDGNMSIGMLTIYGWLGTFVLGGWLFINWEIDNMVMRGFLFSFIFAMFGTYKLTGEQK